MLKKIVLTNGSNLTSLPEEFCCLQSLEHLQLEHCKELSSLPTRFGDLRNLRFLLLSSCWKLRMLPVSFKKLMLLQYLYLGSCSQLILRPEDFQNVRKLEYINLSRCKQLEELPPHITNQASLKELYLEGANKLRELPENIGQLSRLQEMIIGTQLLTSLPISLGDLTSLRGLSIKNCPSLESLPTSLGNLSSLRNLSITDCPSLKCLPQSEQHFNLLENLRIQACPIKVDLGAASLPFGLSNLKDITLIATEVCRISLSEGLYSHLESLNLHKNNHLTEIEALPPTLKSIRLRDCKMLKNIRAPCYLVNLEHLEIVSCPELQELPSFACSTSLREFELLEGCYRVQKIEGLEHCTRLEILKVDSD
ncbi:disease resistance protein RPV1-like [Cryptomeria japonica]|uniref:disease resistance protein RPV1-like n=1 Tax=Cryptomeria japonica TaxID=3369 RepID=UPI0027DAAD1E|nr:disease resistance protein RPV1-like [Cryptomeria japonica]